jgi:ABC-type cobalamin/Fe3+-siderophores transport system ATPase subunit
MERVRKMWGQFKYPDEVKLIGRYVLLGRHTAMSIFDPPSEVSLRKITQTLSTLGVTHLAPAMPI